MQEEPDTKGAMSEVPMQQTHPKRVQNSYPGADHDSSKTLNHPKEQTCPKRLSPAAERGWLCLCAPGESRGYPAMWGCKAAVELSR